VLDKDELLKQNGCPIRIKHDEMKLDISDKNEFHQQSEQVACHLIEYKEMLQQLRSGLTEIANTQLLTKEY
jgi:hypothetical protein